MLKSKLCSASFWSKGALTALFLLISLATLAQPGGPGTGDCGTDTTGGPDDPCPLDTWVVLLAIICVSFAVYQLHQKQKKALQIS
ncbi:hypothetical protein FO440_15545 [Mucilaginibacter corticis]|uniref:Signal peptidase n=1 Tax=Mucilaginibacter corticis TaxID=2597670 RepID=A0A556MGY5_9SPHI|nr:hypothetical protein [Mucilaginibacter corticis]TSJ39177.1 hypothetical protein FO440_15545 [Mucilaginibacter corticis]